MGTQLHDCRDAVVDTLLELTAADPRVVCVVNDSLGSTKVTRVARAFPKRVINVGIAEQDLVGIGAGLANGGKIPFVCAASPFLTGRALEQIKVDAAYSAANVKLIGVSSGVAYGELGPTHHSIEDIAWTRAIDGLIVVVPADPLGTSQAIAPPTSSRGLSSSAPAGCPCPTCTSPATGSGSGAPRSSSRERTSRSSPMASWSSVRCRQPRSWPRKGSRRAS
jgi:transketolase